MPPLPKRVTFDPVLTIIEPQAPVKHDFSPPLSSGGDEDQYHDTTDEESTTRWHKY